MATYSSVNRYCFRMKQKAIFLDRDGVVNKEKGGYVYKLEDWEFVDGLFVALKELRDRGFIFIVITNQGGINKGVYSKADVDTVHAHMEKVLKEEGIDLTAIYYCPHHDNIANCLCRKPGSMMIEKAIAKYNIDPALSVMFGDRDRDTEAAERVGVKGILVEGNDNLKNYFSYIP